MSTIAYHDLAVRPAASARSQRPAVSEPAAPLRLTRRGRLVVFAAAASLLTMLTILLGTSVAATDEAGTPRETVSVQVQPGQTLWQIAAEANPEGDIRRTIDEIVRLNALPNASGLTMGTTLAVPVYAG